MVAAQLQTIALAVVMLRLHVIDDTQIAWVSPTLIGGIADATRVAVVAPSLEVKLADKLAFGVCLALVGEVFGMRLRRRDNARSGGKHKRQNAQH